MKVVHIITSLEQGGAEEMLYKIVANASRCTPAVTHEVVSLGSLGTVGAKLTRKGFNVVALNLKFGLNASSGLWKLIQYLRNAGPDVIVQTWMYHADFLGGVSARIARQRRLVWNVRQAGVGLRDIGLKTRMVVWLCGLLSWWLPRIIVSNSGQAIAVHSELGYCKKKFRMIPNGFETDKMVKNEHERIRVRESWGISKSQFVVGTLGRIDPQKDQGNFVRAAALVHRRRTDTRFVVIGRGATQAEGILRTISSEQMGEKFVLNEERQDTSAVLSAFDVFCLSSRSESFPNVLGEAMSCEVPCITTDCGDARSIVGNDALVVPIENSAELAEKIVNILEMEPEERRDLGFALRERIRTHYSIEAVWNEYLSLYSGLIEEEAGSCAE